MSKIVVIGAGAMGTAFTFPCLDNNHDINIIGTHLENDFIDTMLKNNRLHPGLNTRIPETINLINHKCCQSIPSEYLETSFSRSWRVSSNQRISGKHCVPATKTSRPTARS